MNCITEGCDQAVTHQHLPPDHDLGRFINLGYCYGCAYWQDRADQDRHNPRAFVVERDGALHHYVAGTAKGGNPKGRGSYGQTYRIDLGGNGDPIATEDLWTQGEIPASWVHLFDMVPRGRFLH